MFIRRPARSVLAVAAVTLACTLSVPLSPLYAAEIHAPAPSAAPVADAPSTAGAGSMAEFNQWADQINRSLASWVIAPTLNAWRSLPQPIPAMGRNAFQNLTEPVSAVSRAMSSDTSGALTSASRFAINSTVGLLGTLDVANAVGLPPRKSYFAEGVCKAKIPVGPYVVVPAVGDSTVGVASTALLAMVGSTAALALVSFELAIASTAVDFISTSAALENLADSQSDTLEKRQADYTEWLASVGCRPS